MRQVLDETDGVADQHARHALGVERADGGVERGEELVGDQHFAAGQCAHQRRFAGVGVADERHAGQALAALPPRALGLALDVHGGDFKLQFGDPVADLAPVHLGVRFTGTTAAETASLPPLRPGQLGRLAQTRRHVAEAGDLDLRTRGARARVAVKNFEDDHGPVHDLATDLLFEVARLRW